MLDAQPTDTLIFEKSGLDEDSTKAKLAEVATIVPVRRSSRAAKMAQAVLYLASELSTAPLSGDIVIDGLERVCACTTL